MAPKKVLVVGVGMTEFLKPQSHLRCYTDLANEAATKALKDADIPYSQVKQAVVGYTYGDTDSGQCAVYDIGLTGIPIHNVNNACSTGAAALFLGKQLIQNDENDCIMVLGFEKMEQESYTFKYTDRANPYERLVIALNDIMPVDPKQFVIQMLDCVGKEYMQKYNFDVEQYAKVAYKNHKHSVHNPYARLQKLYSLEEIKNSPVITGGLTKLQYCPLSDGAACVILASENFVKRHNLQEKAVEIVGIEMTTDLPSTFNGKSALNLVGYDMTKLAIEKLFGKSKYTINDVDVIELHDGATTNEVIIYEALGLCEEGGASDFIDRNDNTYGGKFVINPSGGLMSRGHAPGATGLAQCCELCWQLRGEAGKRQVENASLALQHNVGWGGSAVVALYKMGFNNKKCILYKKISTPLFKSFCKSKNKSKKQSNNHLEASSISSEDKSKKRIIRLPDLSKLKPTPEGFLVHPYLKVLGELLDDIEDDVINQTKGIFAFRVIHGPDKSEGLWIFNLKSQKKYMKYNSTEEPEILFIIKDCDITEILLEKLDPRKAFLTGKIKAIGNFALAIKLLKLLKILRPKYGDVFTSIQNNNNEEIGLI